MKFGTLVSWINLFCKISIISFFATVASLRAEGALIASRVRYAGKQFHFLFPRLRPACKICFVTLTWFHTFLLTPSRKTARTRFCRALVTWFDVDVITENFKVGLHDNQYWRGEKADKNLALMKKGLYQNESPWQKNSKFSYFQSNFSDFFCKCCCKNEKAIYLNLSGFLNIYLLNRIMYHDMSSRLSRVELLGQL